MMPRAPDAALATLSPTANRLDGPPADERPRKSRKPKRPNGAESTSDEPTLPALSRIRNNVSGINLELSMDNIGRGEKCCAKPVHRHTTGPQIMHGTIHRAGIPIVPQHVARVLSGRIFQFSRAEKVQFIND